MDYKLFIATKYLIYRRRATIISVIGVMMGLAFFLGISGLLIGMQHYFIKQIVDVSPHITIKDEFRKPDKQALEIMYPKMAALAIDGIKPKTEVRGIKDAEKITSIIANELKYKVEPVLFSSVIITYGTKDIPTTVYGIKPDAEKEIGNIESNMVSGSLDNLMLDTNGIVIGQGLVVKHGLKMGDRVTITSPQGISLNAKIVGVFNTGVTAIDYTQTFMLLKKVQILQDQENAVNLIKIKLRDPSSAQGIAAEIEKRFRYRTESWQETNSNFFSIFTIQNSIMYSTVAAIMIVAGFGIYNIISTLVTEKARDIAIFKSMGFSNKDIKNIFVIQGLIIGVIGAVLGWILGAMGLEMLHHVKFRIEGEGFLRMEGFYLYKSVWLYLGGGALSVLATTVASMIPAVKAASVNPVEIIRGAV